MRKLALTILMLFFSGIVFAQNFSVSLNYFGLITGKNYESASMYTFEGDYEFIENTLSAGFSASIIDSRINKTFIKNPSPDDPYETSFKLGIQAKYFPFLLKEESISLKPFVGIELGVYNTSHIQTYLNMPGSCEEMYWFESQNDFYTNFSIGSIIFPEQTLSIVLGLKYQINNPTIKYKKPNCSDSSVAPDSHSKYIETVNLNMFLWSVGVKINF